MNNYQKEIAVAKTIARQAGEIMKKYFFIDQQMERKTDGSPVTVADKEINHLVIVELSKNFDDGIIGEEESNTEYGMGRKWFCDPIDGTRAYVWGTPTAMFSLGLVVDGEPVLGVTYDPFLDLMYEGVKGQGSFMNGVPLKVSQKSFEKEYLGITKSIEKIIENPKFAKNISSQGAILSTFSGVVYKAALVARGKFIGCVEPLLNAHDIAASQVILEEAGGKVTDLEGSRLNYSKPFRGAAISNGVIHEKLIECLK